MLQSESFRRSRSATFMRWKEYKGAFFIKKSSHQTLAHMKVTSILSAATYLAFCTGANAHSTVWGAWVNGVFQWVFPLNKLLSFEHKYLRGDGRNVYIRSPPNNNPVKDIYSSAMTCNVNNNAAPKTLRVKPGDKYTFEWYHDYRDDEIIASSHKGPILVYIAPKSSNG
jgi:lytic cellulose monooxygenase (C1-hydroxylating)